MSNVLAMTDVEQRIASKINPETTRQLAVSDAGALELSSCGATTAPRMR